MAAEICVDFACDQVGTKNRSVGATLMNQDSSRSHSIFTITVEMLEGATDQVTVYLQM